MKKMTVSDKREALARKLRSAGDSSRLKMLCHIFRVRKACVSDIARELGMNMAIASHHLQALVREGLLKSDREGKRICYALSKDEITVDLKKFICKYN